MTKKEKLKATINELLRQRNMLLENKPEDQFEISQMRAGYLMEQKINEALLFGSPGLHWHPAMGTYCMPIELKTDYNDKTDITSHTKLITKNKDI